MRNPYEPPQVEDEANGRNAEEWEEAKIRQKDVEAALFNPWTLISAAIALAGCGAVTFFTPGVGVPLFIIMGVAVTRMVALTAWRHAKNQPPTPDTRVLLLISSIGVVTLATVSAAIAFVATCFPVGLIGSALTAPIVYGVPGVLVGIGCGIAMVVFLLWRIYLAYFWMRW